VAQLGREPGLESLNALSRNDYPYSVEVDKLFPSYFKTLPNHLGIRDVNIENAHEWFLEKYEDQIWNFHVSGWSTEESESKFNDVYYCLFDDLIIHFGFLRDYISLYFRATGLESIFGIRNDIRNLFKSDSGNSSFFIIENMGAGIDIQHVKINAVEPGIAENYNDDFQEVSNTILRRLSTLNDKGIVLLHGKPGTGKTTYIRYLIGMVKKRVIFLPPNLAESLTDPTLLSMIVAYPNSILVIEDAENIVIDRENSKFSAVSSLLNLSDGLLSDCLNIQIICSFNTDVSRIDKALMRKGRLIAKYEFQELEPVKATRLSARLGKGKIYDVPVLLTDIYNPEEREYGHSMQKPRVGFRI
jgi:hypothetical protein